MKMIPAKLRNLHPTVFALGAVSFFTDMAGDMLYPITPIYLTTVLGTSMTGLGFIEGLAEAMSSILKTYSGYWSDRLGKRKPFIFWGYALSAFSKPAIGIAVSWHQVLLARCTDRLGKGLRGAPRDALIVDVVPHSQRGVAFGWHRAMDTLGAVMGPLIALIFVKFNPQDLRSLFFYALIPGGISVILVFFVKDRGGSTNSTKVKQSNVHTETLKLTKTKENNLWKSTFKKYLFAWGLFSLANSSDVFLLMKAQQSGINIQGVVLLYCAYNLVYAASSPILGDWSDRYGRKKILIGGLCIYALVYAAFCGAKHWWHYLFVFFVYGSYMGATDGVSKALAADLVPPQSRATALGILGSITGLCTLFASIFAGYLWDHYGNQWALLYGAAGALVAAIFMIPLPDSAISRVKTRVKS